MNKVMQGFVKQANLTCRLATYREYDRNRHASMSMPEREENLSRRRECDKARKTDKEQQARFAMLKFGGGG